MALRTELKNIIRLAEKQGWVVSLTKGGHLRWTRNDGAFFFSASTPSDGRALKNIMKELRNRDLKNTRK
jgi:predicted RNA binding protein YcfA (HicA-like mRNA interferase family)